MHKFLLVPDSFKGTMCSVEVCRIMEEAIHHVLPPAEVICLPVADGGEGSVEAFLAALGGRRQTVWVQGPYTERMKADYGLLADGKTAVVEMAACAGLPLVDGRTNPAKTTSYGVGQMMLHAAESGCRKIILCLGGSATNDFGAGAAAAMGIVFTNAQNQKFVPVGETLSEIHRIDPTGLNTALAQAEITVMCDIDNPLYGPLGAAHVFAPQKGAGPSMVHMLDDQLRAVAQLVHSQMGKDIARMPGAGAAGGMGGGMAAFLGAHLQMGIETVLDLVHFEDLLPGTSLVLTGEGKMDGQSLRGKVVMGVARRAQMFHVPVVALVGDIGDHIEPAYAQGLSGVFSINRVALPFSEARTRCRQDLALTTENLLRFFTAFSAS